MDYILASMFALMTTAFAVYYQQLTARNKALGLSHANLVRAINAQSEALVVHAQGWPLLYTEAQNGLRKLRAIQTLGLPGIDQQMELYDILWITVQQETSQELQQRHAYVQTLRVAYNQNALRYNDCQRSRLQSGLALLLGHTMAPPC